MHLHTYRRHFQYQLVNMCVHLLSYTSVSCFDGQWATIFLDAGTALCDTWSACDFDLPLIVLVTVTLLFWLVFFPPRTLGKKKELSRDLSYISKSSLVEVMTL